MKRERGGASSSSNHNDGHAPNRRIDATRLSPSRSAANPTDAYCVAMPRVGAVTKCVLTVLATSLAVASCSSAPTGTELAISGQGDVPINLTSCTLNSSGTQAVATGTFPHPLKYPSQATPSSTTPGLAPFQLSLMIENSNAKVFGVKHLPMHLGATSWTITASVKPGSKPTECVVSIQSTSY